MKNGVINIYKERGFTSHDVVAKLRGILKQKKIGHTGTLDPDAEGVLPVCLGKGTKLCDMLTDHDKVYEAVLLLGQSTDTQDASGTVLSQAEVTSTEEEVREAIMSFVGPYEQIPPMYSALKVNGQKLCDLARAGKEVERKARPVEIYSIDILEVDLPRVRMSVSCSKGTYIRTLCHDIGEKLGCHGCMEKLLRTKVGQFLLDGSLTLGQVEQLRDEDRLDELILPVDQVFVDYPAVYLKENTSRLGYNGNPFYRKDTASPEVHAAKVRVYDHVGQFIGIYEYRTERKMYFPLKMFYEK
ncbi:MAG: tRNA pseudouridine(55) synthase TruB [Lachnospiraceae bacterium]|nr:tRNA pseudouridine(55) synthase TruB [Lachnospiraceae bacterium]